MSVMERAGKYMKIKENWTGVCPEFPIDSAINKVHEKLH
jgi:hypothetical protein